MLLLSVCFGIFLLAAPWVGLDIPVDTLRSFVQLTTALAVAALLLLLPLMTSIALWPLQQAERMLSPRVLDLFQRDAGLRRVGLGLFSFVLLSVALLLIPDTSLFLPAIAGWLILLALLAEALISSYRGLCSFLNPYAVIERYVAQARAELHSGDLLATLTWIEALTEVCIRAVEQGSVTVTSPALSGVQQIMEDYLDQLKQKESGVIEAHELHAAQYPFFDFIEKMQCIYGFAMAKQLTLVAEQVLKVLGKVTVHVAGASPHLMTLPVHHMAELSLESGHSIDRSLVIMQETLRASLERLAGSEQQASEGLCALIKRMHDLSTALFKRNKELPVPLLMQPFTDAKALLSEERFVGRSDVAAALEQCEAALEEYSALSTVMDKLTPQGPVSSEGQTEGQ